MHLHICHTPMQTPCAHYFKANVEYLRRNFKKALKVLCSAPHMPVATDAGECLASFYFNNLGCVHHQLGKYSLAAHYFKKAIEENDAALNGFPPLDRGTHVLLTEIRMASFCLWTEVRMSCSHLWTEVRMSCCNSETTAQQDLYYCSHINQYFENNIIAIYM